MLKLIAKFYQLPLEDKFLILQTIYWLIKIKANLKLFGIQKTYKQINKNLNLHRKNINNSYSVQKVVWAIDSVTKNIINATCLIKALSGFVILKRNGHNPKVEIGVKKKQDKLEAHAWLVLNNKVILGHINDISEYKKMPFTLN